MTLDEAREHAGEKVVYSSRPGEAEEGVIIYAAGMHVFVRYGKNGTPKATSPHCLTLMRGGSIREHIRLNIADAGIELATEEGDGA